MQGSYGVAHSGSTALHLNIAKPPAFPFVAGLAHTDRLGRGLLARWRRKKRTDHHLARCHSRRFWVALVEPAFAAGPSARPMCKSSPDATRGFDALTGIAERGGMTAVDVERSHGGSVHSQTCGDEKLMRHAHAALE